MSIYRANLNVTVWGFSKLRLLKIVYPKMCSARSHTWAYIQGPSSKEMLGCLHCHYDSFLRTRHPSTRLLGRQCQKGDAAFETYKYSNRDAENTKIFLSSLIPSMELLSPRVSRCTPLQAAATPSSEITQARSSSNVQTMWNIRP